MEAFAWALGLVAAFVAGTFFGVFLIGSAVKVVEARWPIEYGDEDEDDDSEAWKRG